MEPLLFFMAKTVAARWECTCDVCGHTWVSRTEELPKTCARRGCNSLKWDSGGGVDTEQKATAELPTGLAYWIGSEKEVAK